LPSGRAWQISFLGTLSTSTLNIDCLVHVQQEGESSDSED